MIKGILSKLISRHDLRENEMNTIMDELFSGKLTNAQIGAFITALATKGETFEELAGAAKAMRSRATRIQVIAPVVVDTCGTGGDGLETFNISTTSAFVIAGCGVTVAKHGNRSVSSKSGSADVLEALGVNINLTPEMVEECIAETGIGFLFAPLYHSAMKHAAQVRKELAIRTIFNMLGPLTNPAGATCQVLGVFAPHLTEMFASALKSLGVRKAFVVHGHDGMDEISVCAPTRITELDNGSTKTYDLYPEMYFGERASIDEIKGGTPDVNAEITRAILAGKEKGAKRNVILINSAAGLVAAGKAETLEEGLKLAEESVDSGAALKKLEALMEFSNSMSN